MLVAEATSKSEQIRGEGDATRNQIFADAFNQDQDFFAFYRSMQAYEHGLKSNDTRMLLTPESSFFRYFHRSLWQVAGKCGAGRAGPLEHGPEAWVQGGAGAPTRHIPFGVAETARSVRQQGRADWRLITCLERWK